MNDKTKNIISVILPLATLIVIALTFQTQTTGLAVYQNKPAYRLNGSISINLNHQERIPADSYVKIKINNYIINTNLIEFIGKSRGHYKIKDGYIIANGIYEVDFTSLGITQRFEKGNHRITVEIINKGIILYSNEEIIKIY